MLKSRDGKFMYAALKLAEKAKNIGEVPVGCVIVHEDKIIASGYNRRERKRNALEHAEMRAIYRACRRLRSWRLIGCELFVTLEPCPMCAGAILNARVDRVVYGASDPKAGAMGSVFDLFEYPLNHKPEVTSGVLGQECGEILSDFFSSLRKKKRNR